MKNKGISLITLLITIIVIIILASAVIIAISNNNPYSAANEAVFKSDLDSFRAELSEYHNTMSIKQGRAYDQSNLQLSSQNIGDAISDLKNNSKYSGKLKVESGSLVFICTNTVEDKWAESIGIKTTCNDGDTGLLMYESNISPNPTIWTNQNVTITINYPEKVVTKQYKVDSGEWTSYTEPFVIDKNSIVYARGFDSNSTATNVVSKYITNIDKEAPSIALNGNSSVTITAGNTYTEQSATASDTLSGINGNLAIAGNIDTNTPGTYALQYTATDKAGNSSTVTRTVIVNAPSIPPSFAANPTSWTNGDVTTSITYSSYSSVKEYSYDTVNWTSYTQPLVIGTNNTTIYARGKDNKGNIVGVSNMKIANIDKVAPTISLNGESNVSIVAGSTYTEQNATVSDALSGIKGSVVITGSLNVNTPGTYTLQYTVNDNANNSSTVTRTVTVTQPPVPTSWSYFNVITTTTTWTAPKTAWYKFHIIGKGGNGGSGGWSDTYEGSSDTYWLTGGSGSGAAGGGLAISTAYLTEGTTISAVVDSTSTSFGIYGTAYSGRNGNNGGNPRTETGSNPGDAGPKLSGTGGTATGGNVVNVTGGVGTAGNRGNYTTSGCGNCSLPDVLGGYGSPKLAESIYYAPQAGQGKSTVTSVDGHPVFGGGGGGGNGSGEFTYPSIGTAGHAGGIGAPGGIVIESTN